jgi:hypothetical protein
VASKHSEHPTGHAVHALAEAVSAKKPGPQYSGAPINSTLNGQTLAVSLVETVVRS